MAAKAVVGKLSRRLQVRVLSGAPLNLYNSGLLHFEAQHSPGECVQVCTIYGERSSVGRAPDCDSGGRGFKPHRSPHIFVFPEGIRTGDTSYGRMALIRVLIQYSSFIVLNARVAELVDALDLGSCGVTRESSSLSFRTIMNNATHVTIPT